MAATQQLMLSVKPASGGGGTPTFVRESVRLNVDGGSSAVVGFPLTGMTTIPIGHRAVFMLAVSQTVTVSSLTDGLGNTWTVNLTGNSAGESGIAICSSVLSTALTTLSTITVTFSSATAGPIAASLVDVTGTTAVDSTAAVNHTFATSVSISGTTVAAATIAFAVLCNDSNGTYNYSGSSWTMVGADGENFASGDTRVCWFMYKELASAGTQNPNGTWTTGNVDQVNGWVAYK